MVDPFGGIPVVISYDQPGYVLPLDLPLPPAFREQFNAWAAGFFHPKPSPIPDGRIVFENPGGLYGPGGRQRLHMNQRTHVEFIRTIKENS